MSFRFNFVGRPPQVLSEDKTCERDESVGGRFELCRLDLILSAMRFKFCLRTKIARGLYMRGRMV